MAVICAGLSDDVGLSGVRDIAGFAAGKQGEDIVLRTRERTGAFYFQGGHGSRKFAGLLDGSSLYPLVKITGHIGVAASGGVYYGGCGNIRRDIIEHLSGIDHGTHATQSNDDFFYPPLGENLRAFADIIL